MGRIRKSFVGRPMFGAKCAHCRERLSLRRTSVFTWCGPILAAHAWALVVVLEPASVGRWFSSLSHGSLIPVFLLGYAASFILHNRQPLERS